MYVYIIYINYDISFPEIRRPISNSFGLVWCQKRHTQQNNSSKVTAFVKCYNCAQKSRIPSTYIPPQSYDFRQKSPIHSDSNP